MSLSEKYASERHSQNQYTPVSPLPSFPSSLNPANVSLVLFITACPYSGPGGGAGFVPSCLSHATPEPDNGKAASTPSCTWSNVSA